MQIIVDTQLISATIAAHPSNSARVKRRIKMKTVNVKAWGQMSRAYFEDGQVRVWDSIAGYYTTCHSLTAGQVRYVKSRASR